MNHDGSGGNSRRERRNGRRLVLDGASLLARMERRQADVVRVRTENPKGQITGAVCAVVGYKRAGELMAAFLALEERWEAEDQDSESASDTRVPYPDQNSPSEPPGP